MNIKVAAFTVSEQSINRRGDIEAPGTIISFLTATHLTEDRKYVVKAKYQNLVLKKKGIGNYVCHGPTCR